ncbi:MAG: hypothetical protein N3J91_10545 [Verrucomicrobiae bacterium]|nr:hypothetical protein [Verrucomicrobiae bacterium]
MKNTHWLTSPRFPAMFVLALSAALASGAPAFQASTNGFAFDTGFWRGQLQANGKTFGLVPVQDTNNRTLARSMGWLAVYRVFSDGRRYGGGGWDWPHESRLQADGSVKVFCPAEAERPFDFTGRYLWRDARTVDLELTIVPRQPLKGFEVFVASYFAPAYSNAWVWTAPADGGPPQLTRAAREAGDWQMFPRRPELAGLIQDGRWKLEPHPVEWTLRSPFVLPIAIRQAPGRQPGVVIFGDPVECFAMAMPYETEGHYSLYFSLFGRDLPAQKPATARLRLQALPDLEWATVQKAWQNFTKAEGGN